MLCRLCLNCYYQYLCWSVLISIPHTRITGDSGDAHGLHRLELNWCTRLEMEIFQQSFWAVFSSESSSEFFWSPVVRCPFVYFSHFLLLLQNQMWHKASLGGGDSIFFKWRATHFPRGDNYEIAKNTLTNLKTIFSRTTGPISTKLGTKHSLVGIQVSSNKEPFNSLMGFCFS